MHHSATRSLLERDYVIVVASVSSIYGLGSVETYSDMTLTIKKGDRVNQRALIGRLVELQYKRNDAAFQRGAFRVRGDTVEVFPSHQEDRAWRFSLFGDELEEIVEFDPLTGEKAQTLDNVKLYANSHYVTPRPTLQQAVKEIKVELAVRLEQLHAEGKLLEAQRLEQRSLFDIEMMMATGSCPGIENYSRYLTGRPPGAPPPSLFEYIPEEALLFIDESHVTVPQVGGMFRGDDFPGGGSLTGLGSWSAYARTGGDIGDNQSWRLGVYTLQSDVNSRATEEGALTFVGQNTLYAADLR